MPGGVAPVVTHTPYRSVQQPIDLTALWPYLDDQQRETVLDVAGIGKSQHVYTVTVNTSHKDTHETTLSVTAKGGNVPPAVLLTPYDDQQHAGSIKKRRGIKVLHGVSHVK